jgi:cytochrome oxidase assembly protein ShyY1
MFECVELHWTEYLKAIGPTLIAVFIAYVAYQQWQVNRANLKERLFERRMKIFSETQSYLSEILRDAKISDKSMWAFNETHQMARFLFGKEIQDYLIEIRSRSIKMNFLQKKFSALPVGDKRSALVSEEHLELVWLTDQLNVIFDIFEPFLSFENHK